MRRKGEMELHTRYRVQYLNRDRSADYELVGTFLGATDTGALMFDCRPYAGTQTIPDTWPVKLTQPTIAPHRAPHRVL